MDYQEQLKADQERLNELLMRMDVPSMRREFSQWNLMWLQRNLGIRNRDHPDMTEAMNLVNKLHREFFE